MESADRRLETPILRPTPPRWVAPMLALGLIAINLAVRVWPLWHDMVPFTFGVCLALFGWVRSRKYLWITAAALIAITLLKFVAAIPLRAPDGAPVSMGNRVAVATIILVDLLVLAITVHMLIGALQRLQARNDELAGRNRDRAEREEYIARQNEQLKQQAQALDVRRREAEELSIRKTRFLAAVSHDIRTPANAIILLAELLRRTAAFPEQAAEVPELANELHASAVSLVNLLSDVLDLARYDSGKFEIAASRFTLGSVLAEQQRQMQPLAEEKRLSLRVATPDPDITLDADRMKLHRVLANLIGNAIKFTERGGVEIDTARTADGGVQIRVADSGVGIAPEHQAHIFDEFFQLSNPERDRGKGTGLGLTICKRILDAMNGRIDLQSAVGAGSTFTVFLPAADVVDESDLRLQAVGSK